MSALESLCESKGVRAIVRPGAPPNPNFPDAQGYTVTLVYKRRRITTPFYTGRGWTRFPSAADVLCGLLLDASSYESAQDLADFLSDGYAPNAIGIRSGIKAFEACKAIAPKLRRFLGEDFETFTKAEH